jgi:MprA protease rhombosortase-interaction domain-containing protein
MLRRVGVVAALAVGALGLFASPSSALSEWGTGAFTWTMECASGCTNFSNAPGGMYQNEVLADAFHGDSRGHATAEASFPSVLNPGLPVPQVRAEAASTGGINSADADAFGVEGYTYTGPGSQTFTLNITLTGTVSDPTPADLDTFLHAQVYVFEEAGFDFQAASADPENAIIEGATAIDFFDQTVYTSGTTVGSVDVTLTSGQSVYVFARLRAYVERDGGFADGYNTLTMSFADPTGLLAASPVPEPSAGLLVAAGLIGFASRRRMRA